MSVTYAVVVPHRIGTGWIGGRLDAIEWGAHGASTWPSSQVYARRRLLAGMVFVTLVTLVWLGTSTVLANRGSAPASTSTVRPAAAAAPLAAAAASATPVAAPYIVQPGDTLWSIAERLRGDHSLADYVAALVDVNGGASVSVGQQLVLP
jgi:LysM repeat protein